MPLISVSTEATRRAAQRFAAASKSVEAAMDEKVGPEFVAKAKVGIQQIYTTKTGNDGDGIGTPDAGADGQPFWVITWEPADGTFGTLRVFSDHPYVLGYEYGVEDHKIDPTDNVEKLHFESMGAEWFLGPDKVLHAHVTAKHKLPALIRYLQEMGTYGWATAIWSILNDELAGE